MITVPGAMPFPVNVCPMTNTPARCVISVKTVPAMLPVQEALVAVLYAKGKTSTDA